MPKSFAVDVKTKRGSGWATNQLRFYTPDDAQNYADWLTKRWTDVAYANVRATEEPPNAIYPVPSDRYGVPR